jgi:hypothetical protein
MELQTCATKRINSSTVQVIQHRSTELPLIRRHLSTQPIRKKVMERQICGIKKTNNFTDIPIGISIGKTNPGQNLIGVFCLNIF